MSRLRDEPSFPDLLGQVGEQLRLPVGLIEKDYWLTQILAALVTNHFGQFVLKGGTSLSKGYGLLARFSEDADVLLVPQQGDEQQGVIIDMVNAIEATIDAISGLSTAREHDDPGVAAVVAASYPPAASMVDGLEPSVRVDVGVPGGPIPHDNREVTALLLDALREAGDATDYDDLRPVSVPVLHPVRTLVEKLIITHAIGRRIQSGNPAVRSREARHFYDLWFLLDEERCPALGWLRQHGAGEQLVADCERITARFYDRKVERPAEGYHQSPAFTNAEVGARVEKSYSKMVKTLGFPGHEQPSFDDVRDRVATTLSGLDL